MKWRLIILSFFISIMVHAQINMTQFDIPVQKERFELKRYLPPISTAFVSGFMDGTNQTLLHHYSAFKRVFPEANDQTHDPRISWKNKWEIGPDGKVLPGNERFFGSSTYFVALTDTYHFTRSMDWWMVSWTISLHPERYRKKWWEKSLEVFGYSLARKAGFHLAYSFIFKS